MKTTVNYKELKKLDMSHEMFLGTMKGGAVCLVSKYCVVALTGAQYVTKGSTWTSATYNSAEAYAEALGITRDDGLIVTLESDENAD